MPRCFETSLDGRRSSRILADQFLCEQHPHRRRHQKGGGGGDENFTTCQRECFERRPPQAVPPPSEGPAFNKESLGYVGR